jgi:histidine ammonia-lyase
MTLALAFDALRVGLAHIALLSERRMNKMPGLKYGADDSFLIGQESTEAPAPLAGFVSYAAAALVAELKHLAAPISLECPPLDLDVEDHATLAPSAVLLTRRSLRRLETVLAIEALLAVEVLDLQKTPPRLGAGTRAAYQALRRLRDELGAHAASSAVVEAACRALHEMT